MLAELLASGYSLDESYDIMELHRLTTLLDDHKLALINQ
jgi:hypothetical protein